MSSFYWAALSQARRRAKGKRKRSQREFCQYESLESRRVLNAVPIALDDLMYFTPVDTNLVVAGTNGVLQNDFDADSPYNFAQNYSTTAQGVTLTSPDIDGSFTYQPPAGFQGVDSFTYEVRDSSSNISQATAYITVGHGLSPQLNLEERVNNNFLHSGALMWDQELGGGMQLFYRSDSIPVPIVSVETMLAPGTAVPDSITVDLVFGGISGDTINYDTSNLSGGDTMRFTQRVLAPTLATGMHDWTMTVTLDYSGSGDIIREFTGQQAVVNRIGSEFGNGWWLGGLDRIHVQPNEGILLENADGSTYWFAEVNGTYQRAAGDLSYLSVSEGASGFTLTDKWGDTREFDATGNLTSIKRLGSNFPDFTFTYAQGRIDSIADAFGRSYEFFYDGNDRLDYVIDFAEITHEVTVTSGLLTNITYAAYEAATPDYPNFIAPQWNFGYTMIGGHSYFETATDTASQTTTYDYNEATRRVERIIHADNSDWRLYPMLTQGYSGTSGNAVFETSEIDARYIEQVTATRDEIFRFRTDGFGNMTWFKDAENAETTLEYDSNAQLFRIVGADPDGGLPEYQSAITKYGYSALGDLLVIVNPDGSRQTGTYDEVLHRVRFWTNELNFNKEFGYYTNGNLEYYQDAEFNRWSYAYDAFGRVTTETTPDPDGSGFFGGPKTPITTTYVYDPADFHRLSEIQFQDGTRIEFAYTPADQIASVIDELDRATSYVYDPLNRLVKTTLPDPDFNYATGVDGGPLVSPVYKYTYGANLLLASVIDPLNNETKYEYHAQRHWLTKVTLPDPDGAGPLLKPVTQYTYYDNGLRFEEYRPEFINGKKITYNYDGNGQLTTVDGPLPGQQSSYTYDALGRMKSSTDPSGRTINYKFDIRDRVTQVIDHDPDGAGPLESPVINYVYDDAGQLTHFTDAIGRATEFTYYPIGLLNERILPNPDPESGETYKFQYRYDDLGRLIEVIDAAGRMTNYDHDVRNRIVTITNPDPDPDNGTDTDRTDTHYLYDDGGRIQTLTDELDRVTTFGHDNLDRMIQMTLPKPTPTDPNPVYTFKYDAVGNRTEVKDPVNRLFQTTYDNLYRVKTYYETKSGPLLSGGPLSTSVTPNWKVKYNDQLQIAEIEDPLGRKTTRTYDDAGRLVGVADPLLNMTTYTRDLMNRVYQMTSPDPDGAGNPLEPSVTTYNYDILSRITSIVDPTGTISNTYDAAGQTISLTDQNGNTTRWAYDVLGRTTFEQDELGNTRSFLYDSANRLVRRNDKNDRVTWFSHDGYLRTESWYQQTGPAPDIAMATTTEGDPGNEVQTVTLQNAASGVFRLAFGGEVTPHMSVFSTDAEVEAYLEGLNSIDDVQVTLADGVYTITFVGAHAGKNVEPLMGDVITEDDGDEIRRMNFLYDEVFRLVSIDDLEPDSGNPGQFLNASASYDYLYDDLDRMTSQTENIRGLTPEVLLEFDYDLVNRRRELSAKIGGTADYLNTYTYDILDRPHKIVQDDQGGHAVAYKQVQFSYNVLGQLTYIHRQESAATFTSLRTSFNYDLANRLSTIAHRHTESGSALQLNDNAYQYDFMSRIIQINSLLDGLSTFAFDGVSQLTDAVHNGANRPDEAYVYDGTGNRTNGYVVTANNRTESDGTYSYQYDNEGNRIRRTLIADGSFTSYSYDHRNRLVRVEFHASNADLLRAIDYTYDAYNRLVRRSLDADGSGNNLTDEFFAGFDRDNPTLHFDGSETADLAHRYLWGATIDQLLSDEVVDSLSTEGEILWALQDAVGTIRDIGWLNDATGDFEIKNHRTYDSFGKLQFESNGAVDLAFGFTGKWTDADTGLTHHLYRWYDPNIGKWISEDPLSFSAGDTNFARYVGNSPLQRTDPNGLDEAYTNYNANAGDAGSGSMSTPGQPPQGGDVNGELSFLNGKVTFLIITSPKPVVPTEDKTYEVSINGKHVMDLRIREYGVDPDRPEGGVIMDIFPTVDKPNVPPGTIFRWRQWVDDTTTSTGGNIRHYVFLDPPLEGDPILETLPGLDPSVVDGSDGTT